MTRALSASIVDRARVREAGGGLVDANDDVRRQFAGDLVQYRRDRVHRRLNFGPHHVANLSWHVLARRNDQAIHFETNARHARDSRKQDRMAMLGHTLGYRSIQKIHVCGKSEVGGGIGGRGAPV